MSVKALAACTRVVIVVSIGGLVVAGCASRSTVRRLQSEVGNLRASVGELGRGIEEAAQSRTRLTETVKQLETRVDEFQTEARRSGEESAQVRRRLDAAEATMRETRALLEALPRPTATAPDREAAPRPEPPRPAAAEQVYDTALASLRSGEHGQAVLDFTDFLAKYPRHALAPDAQFWIAEAYYSQRDCRQAVIEYQRVLDYGAGASRAPETLLKIGLCHASLRDDARARQAWQRLLREYPAADAAIRARSLLRARGVVGRP